MKEIRQTEQLQNLDKVQGTDYRDPMIFYIHLFWIVPESAQTQVLFLSMY